MKNFDLTDDQMYAARQAIHDWIPQQLRWLLDKAEEAGQTDPDWMVEDDLATQLEVAANAARVEAKLGFVLDAPGPQRIVGLGPCALCGRDPAEGSATTPHNGATVWLCHTDERSCFRRWLHGERPGIATIPQPEETPEAG